MTGRRIAAKDKVDKRGKSGENVSRAALFDRMRKNVNRLYASPVWSRLAVSVTTIILTVIVVSVILLLIGRDPLKALYSFFQGSGLAPKPSYSGRTGMFSDLFSFLGIQAPMLLASLGVLVGLRGGLFNIGISGQMLCAGFLATIVVGYSDLTKAAAIPLAIVIGLAAGGLLGTFVGWMKYRFNIHEVVSTIMINYIVSFLTGFFIKTKYVDPIVRSSKAVRANARLNITGLTISHQAIVLPIGIFVALLCVFLIRFLMDRTTEGFEIRMVGANRECSRYAGVGINRVVMRTMAISGMLAGLAGVTYYLGYYNTIIPKELPTLGYDSIAVALLGNLNPIGCVFSSFLITIFQKGAVYMSASTGVVREIASVITGILLLFSAFGSYIRENAILKSRQLETVSDKPGGGTESGPPEAEKNPDLKATQGTGEV